MWEQRRVKAATVHKRCGISIAMLCIVIARMVAAEPLLDEQNIDEKSIINALKPEAADNKTTTRGLVHRLVPDSGGMMPTNGGSLNLLITFGTNSTTLTDRARAALDKVAHAMDSVELSEYRFRIEGHADPRGNPDANMKLSADRAVAVLEYLTRKDGVAPERLLAIGKGSSEPLNIQNPTAPENRRVTIVRLPG
ncbi:OmpA family protein [Paraburkholderia phymatum]|uniref:OmpA family protein n=1 Tax=Paraburkholderia phymatum TaxID=148447 RepID=UPI003181B376